MRILFGFVYFNLLVGLSSSACLDITTDSDYCSGVSPCFDGDQLTDVLASANPIPLTPPVDGCYFCEHDNNCPNGESCYNLGLCLDPEVDDCCRRRLEFLLGDDEEQQHGEGRELGCRYLHELDEDERRNLGDCRKLSEDSEEYRRLGYCPLICYADPYPCSEDCDSCVDHFDLPYPVCACGNGGTCPGGLPCTPLGYFQAFYYLFGPFHTVGFCWEGDGNREEDEDDNDDAASPCLSAFSTVKVLGEEGSTRVEDLQIGDEIAVSDNAHQQVYAFGHHDVYSVGHFLKVEIFANDGVEPLEISPEHLLFKFDAKTSDSVAVRADSVQEGDFIVGLVKDERVQIKSVSMIERQGLYSPLVLDGSYFAGEMKVSSYTAANGNRDPQCLRIGNYPVLSHHTLSHVGMSPFRVLCQSGLKQICDSRNSEGQLLFAGTGDSLSQPLSFLLSLVILPLYLLEQFLNFTGTAGALCGISLFSASFCFLFRKCFKNV